MMRTKILALFAAVTAACIVTSVAQTVYSVNAVGYVNVIMKPGFNLVANPLVGETNTVGVLFADMPNKTVIYKFNADTGAYVSSTKAFGKFSDPNMTLVPGEGAFVKNPDATDHTITFVGEVMQGSLTNNLPAGYSIASSQVPQAGTLDDLGFPKANKDAVYKWNGAAYETFTVAFGKWAPSTPSVAVAEAFFTKKVGQAFWTREFSVNQ